MSQPVGTMVGILYLGRIMDSEAGRGSQSTISSRAGRNDINLALLALSRMLVDFIDLRFAITAEIWRFQSGSVNMADAPS